MRLIFLGAVLSALLPLVADGARFPNAVENTVRVSGDAATTVASWFGLTAAGARFVSLQLGPNDAWAVYLLKHDTTHEITNGDGPTRYNTVRFATANGAALSLGPYWLDLGTRAPLRQPGYYSFGSPFLNGDLTARDPWTKLLRRLRGAPGWSRGATLQFERCATSRERTEICMRVYGAKDYTKNTERDGYSVTITVHPPGASP